MAWELKNTSSMHRGLCCYHVYDTSFEFLRSHIVNFFPLSTWILMIYCVTSHPQTYCQKKASIVLSLLIWWLVTKIGDSEWMWLICSTSLGSQLERLEWLGVNGTFGVKLSGRVILRKNKSGGITLLILNYITKQLSKQCGTGIKTDT